MAVVNKIDSNSTNLSYAVETAAGVVDGSVTWFPLEPNSYKGFGGDVKTKARMPINSSRQLKKGVVVDLDASGGWQQDLTQDNFQDLSQSFFCAALRTKAELADAIIDGTGNAYQPASGGTAYQASDLLFAKGFNETTNNGLKVVSGAPVAANIAVTDTALVDETGASGTISRVGFQFASTIASINATVSDLPKLEVANVTAAQTYTVGGGGSVIQDGDTLVSNGRTYTWQTSLTNVDGHVLIGANDTAALLNMKNAINLGTNGGTYAAAMTANTSVSGFSSNATTLVVHALVTGAKGNLITTTETSAGSWGSTTLASGAGRDLTTLGLIPGEFVFVGSDETNTAFATAANNGFARVREVAAGFIKFDKTQHVMVDDAGTGKTIRIYFGRVIKNESDPTLIIRRSVQLERTLGAPDDAQPTEIQAEYLTRALGNTLKLDTKTADIVRMDLDFLCNTNELNDGPTGLKVGTRPSLPDADAFNATSDVAFTKMAIVTTGDSCPTPLFSFFTDLVVELKNNIKQNKAVGVLGAFDSTLGFFEVNSTLTAYFTSVAEMQAVKDNDSVTVEAHFVKFNQGVTVDLPLVVLSKAMADVKINEPVMIPLQSDAATAKLIDPDLDYTMLWVFWDYLPTLAG